MLKGYNPQLIKSELNIPRTTVYRDYEYLTNKSKQYVYDMAKGLHALSYQRAIEGLGLALSEAWNKFHSEQIPEKQRVAYLQLIKEINESMMQLTSNGPCVLALQDLTKRAQKAGINMDVGANDFNPDDKIDDRYEPSHIN